MKKNVFVAGIAAVLVLAASAQIVQKDEPPKPPAPPKAPIERKSDVPPPPPPPPVAPPAPDAPPPPPPPPAIPDAPMVDEWISDDYDAFMQRNPSVKGLSWNSESQLTVYLKSGKKETYNLADEKSKKAAVDKYGELPQAPPPPPPPPTPRAGKGHLTLS